ncbi:hypothetical protein DPQ33_13585 [Oceanidesulfovibrio indonesiensis]|uniref:OmpA-like domain-containing protein n=1 Tax=Oceanidesulfovibrio indonesiensis TaxID=54767 RepID=A0A7M3MCA7_9BACT|nr:OmpA family protein [Oceanidesulfovibrio indonesiensis]TVM15994.1 hypothetical protein DPQ33_13585 [Oceanidesulfovibrio indonesiensis]
MRRALIPLFLLCFASFMILGCEPKPQVVIAPISPEIFQFPNGATLPANIPDRAGALGEIAVAAHSRHMAGGPNMAANRESVEIAMDMFYDLSQAQGAGEVTLFFDTGKSTLNPPERDKLEQFLSRIAAESYGRTVHLLIIGSASATGPRELNTKLSTRRVEATLPYVQRMLSGAPYATHPINAMGEMYSPRNVPYEVHKLYQYAQVIAAYGP